MSFFGKIFPSEHDSAICRHGTECSLHLDLQGASYLPVHKFRSFQAEVGRDLVASAVRSWGLIFSIDRIYY